MTLVRGHCAFPVTPTDDRGRVDRPALRLLLARLAEARVDCVGMLGSTGGYAYLTRRERRRAIETAAETLAGLPMTVGIGALRTDKALRLAQDARAIGATAGLLAMMSYTPLAEDEVFEHIATVAQGSGLPLIIYDNPATTHFAFSPDLIARLARLPGIVAVKSPTTGGRADRAHLNALRAQVPEGFALGYSGDWNAVDLLVAGADVWFSVLGGLFPGICQRIATAVAQGDPAEALRLNALLSPVWDLFRSHSSLRVVYAMANLTGLCPHQPPRPILPLSGVARQRVADVLAALPAEVTTLPPPPAGPGLRLQ